MSTRWEVLLFALLFFMKKSPSTAGLSTLISKLVPMNDWLKYIKIQQDPS
ncbi:hypothetical protein [Bacillus altitudinis]|nr:hypothetical protein [Bacillus altitudinis]